MSVTVIVVIGMIVFFFVFGIIPFVIVPWLVPGRWSMFTTTAYLTRDLGETYKEAYLEAMENERLKKWKEELDEVWSDKSHDNREEI